MGHSGENSYGCENLRALFEEAAPRDPARLVHCRHPTILREHPRPSADTNALHRHTLNCPTLQFACHRFQDLLAHHGGKPEIIQNGKARLLRGYLDNLPTQRSHQKPSYFSSTDNQMTMA